MIYPGAPFTQEEKEAIATARASNPTTPQRTLANKLHDNYVIGPGRDLRHRSKQAIYGALRRHDSEQARKRAERQLVGTGANSTGVDDQHAPDPNAAY